MFLLNWPFWSCARGLGIATINNASWDCFGRRGVHCLRHPKQPRIMQLQPHRYPDFLSNSEMGNCE